MKKLICKFLGHKWLPDNVDVFANLIFGGQCLRCKKRTPCVGYELDYQQQIIIEMIKQDLERSKLPNEYMLY